MTANVLGALCITMSSMSRRSPSTTMEWGATELVMTAEFGAWMWCGVVIAAKSGQVVR
jgi:hypothetical protein